MTGPLYNLFIVHAFRESYYQLSEVERQGFWSRIESVSTATGSKNLLTCTSVWCNEAVLAWGLEVFADLHALQESARMHQDNQHLRYLETETFLGTKQGDEAIPTVDFSNPIYQLWMVKAEAMENINILPEQERDHLWAEVQKSIESNGGISLLLCSTLWANEEYGYFGVTAWPNLEAEQEHFKDLEKIGWHRYVHGRTILGTPME
jgi:hypothetical protein